MWLEPACMGTRLYCMYIHAWILYDIHFGNTMHIIYILSYYKPDKIIHACMHACMHAI